MIYEIPWLKNTGFPTLKPPGGATSQVVLRDPNAIEKRGSKGGNSLDFFGSWGCISTALRGSHQDHRKK